MTMTLYDLSVEGLEIERLLTESDGELTPEIEARLDSLLTAGPDRVEAAAMVVSGLEKSADACNIEAARLWDRGAGFTDQAKRLKARIVAAVDAAFGGKVKTPRFTVWAQSSAGTFAAELKPGRTIEELEAARPELVRVKKELNKSAIVEAAKKDDLASEWLDVRPVEGTRSLRIK